MVLQDFGKENEKKQPREHSETKDFACLVNMVLAGIVRPVETLAHARTSHAINRNLYILRPR